MTENAIIPAKHQPIAIVGVSALYPGSNDARGFWGDILAGTDMVKEIPETHWLVEDYYDSDLSAPDKTYGKRGAFLNDVSFNPLEFGVPPSIVPATDTAQLLALIVAQNVLNDATGGQFATMDKERVSVILGVTSAQELLGDMVSRLQRPIWQKSLREAGVPESKVVEVCQRISDHYTPWQESTFPGLLGNVVAGRIANRLDLGGTNCVTDAACASTFSATLMAVNELSLGQSDLVITGGVDTMNDIFMYMCFSKTPALSQSGDCRPFSDQADGTILGEGIGMVALKRLSDAERDNDRIYAVLRGIGASSDGRSKSVYAPVPKGQAQALRRAYTAAGYGPETVELVEGHGTGTKAGDAAEFEGLRLAFEESGREDRGWCSLGSVKSQIGHAKAAAGAAGLFKSVMALHHKVLPPTIKVSQPNPKLEMEKSPFHLNTRARPWVRGSDHLRRASVSSFGFGGSNYHIALEEYAGEGNQAYRLRHLDSELVVLSGASPEALCETLQALEVSGESFLSWFARESQKKFVPTEPARLSIVATNDEDLVSKVKQAVSLIENCNGGRASSPNGIYYSCGEVAGDVAFLFPGQGSQYIDMGAALAMQWDEAVSAWDCAADIHMDDHCELHNVVFPRSAFDEETKIAQEKKLLGTQWAQPAIGVASMALLNLLAKMGVAPQHLAGHSFGEITALYAAGSMTREDMIGVARKRGELMHEAAATEGAMIAVAGVVEKVMGCLSEDCGVVLANHNAPEQVVLSGRVPAIERAASILEESGFKVRHLKVATAFHSEVVAESVAPFGEYLKGVKLKKGTLPVYACSSAAIYPKTQAAMRKTLAEQIAKPVRFVEQIEAMYAAGARTFVEVGPGSVLTNLTKQILGTQTHSAINLDRKGKNAVTSFHHGLAQLAVAGVNMNLEVLWEAHAHQEDPRKIKTAVMELKLNGANYDKPYPPKNGAAGLPLPNAEVEPEVIVQEVVKEIIREVPAEVAARTNVEHQKEINMNHEQETNTLAPALEVTQVQPALSGTDYAAWLHAFTRLQETTVQAHASFQKTMADTHVAFLQSTETTMVGLASVLSGQPTSYQSVAAPVTNTPIAAVPVEQIATPVQAAPVVQQPAIATAPVSAAPMVAPVQVAVTAPVTESVTQPVQAEPVVPLDTTPTSLDLHALLLSVVAQKTGYPTEMLSMEMDLESDLGIDSIKRVEILSAVSEKAPSLPDIDPSAMADLKTLGQIVSFMGMDESATNSPENIEATPSTSSTNDDGIDLMALLLEVVAEKTGYPTEMLSMEMDLESDLGIDSIKRVEILSAITDRAPGLPEIDPAAMAELKTLGQIVEHMESGLNLSVLASKGQEAGVSTVGKPLVDRYIVKAVATAAIGLRVRGLASLKSLVIVTSGSLVATELASYCATQGVSATVVDEVPQGADGVIYLGGLGDSQFEKSVEAHSQALSAAKTLAGSLPETGGLFVTVQDTGGDFGLSGSERAFLGGLTGLAKTAALEWEGASVRAIDIECGERSPKVIAEAIGAELFHGGIELEVGLSKTGKRITLQTQQAAVAQGKGSLSPGDVVVASGGARGVTAATVVALAKNTPLKFVLLGRSPLAAEPKACEGIVDDAQLKRVLLQEAKAAGEALTPAKLGSRVSGILASREINATLAAIRERGSEARYCVADIRDADSIAEVLVNARSEWGPVKGIIHGAGVLADKLIQDKSLSDFEKVYMTKVQGLKALLDATHEDPLTSICLFSSVAARAGNIGQCDYAMANEVLNKVAAWESRRRGPSCRVKSLNWGPWEGGMVTPALEAHFKALGVPLIPLTAGADILVNELQMGDSGDIEIVVGGDPQLAGLRGEKTGIFARFEIHVSQESHPYLIDHAIQGKPVIPMALVLDWFTRSAKASRRDLRLVRCGDLKVLKGVSFADFSVGESLQIEIVHQGDAQHAELELRLLGSSGRPHYAARAELARNENVVRPKFESAQGLSPWNESVYGGVLFHGPQFQVIQNLEGIGDEGGGALLSGVRQAGWKGVWESTDPAALDGGLQLALLWGQRVLGGASLPTGLGSYQEHQHNVNPENVRCSLRKTRVEKTKAICDIQWADTTGTVLAELRGVETHLLPSKRA